MGEWVVSDGQGAGRRGAGQPRGLTKLVCTGTGPGELGVGGDGGAGGGHSPSLSWDACSSPGGASSHGGHGLPPSAIPGLCLLGITVLVTKSLLSWGWQGARLSSSR